MFIFILQLYLQQDYDLLFYNDYRGFFGNYYFLPTLYVAGLMGALRLNWVSFRYTTPRVSYEHGRGTITNFFFNDRVYFLHIVRFVPYGRNIYGFKVLPRRFIRNFFLISVILRVVPILHWGRGNLSTTIIRDLFGQG